MWRYVLRRLVLAIPVLFGVSLGVFLMADLVPGDPATVLAGDTASPDTIARLRDELGLDQPAPVRYWKFLERLVIHGSLGLSTRTHREVLVEVWDRLPYTLELALGAVVLSTVVGVAFGVLAAMRRGHRTDYAITGVAAFALSIPSFLIALLMVMLFSLTLHWLPVAGADSWRHLVLPTIALALHSAAVKARITRSSMLEVLNQDYLRTARAKGLRERVVVWRHALKNALIPITTIIGLQFGSLLGGAYIIENIFGWPGIGRLATQAVFNRDFPIVQGTVLLGALVYFAANLIVDLLYAWLDPRIRYA
ncbi:MAG TPA: ABC transporter permease [Candidatus Limnocylindria bacterium]|nr:ABC transporter permease [Candidatus Limnocylindria bacterium]